MLLQSALDYLKLGFAVFPLKPNEKIPNGALAATGVKEASRDVNQVKRWWAQSPNANIGVALGEVSGYFCVDLDDGATEEDLKLFPRTVTAKTRDGYHLYFKLPPGGIKNQTDLKLPNASGRVSTAKANVRAFHLYVVGVGSSVEGWEYTWHSDLGGELSPQEVSFSDAIPDWLLGAAAPPANPPVAPGVRGGTRPGAGRPPKLATEGSRHAKLLKVAVAMRKKGKSDEEIKTEVTRINNERFDAPKDQAEIDKLCSWVLLQVQAAEFIEPECSSGATIDLVFEFLEFQKHIREGQPYFRTYREDFYVFDEKEGLYRQVHNEIIDSDINRWCMATGKAKLASINFHSQIRKLICTEPLLVQSQVETPALFSGVQAQGAKHLLPFRNGILDMKKYVETGEVDLRPHTPEFFCTYSLPFDFDPKATCPTFDKIADFAFGNPEERLLWEEILGIHLYQPFLLEYFFVLFGQGHDGKSVLTLVLQLLLGGIQNTSSIGLENFKSSDFLFPGVVGKLANIVSDQRDITNIDEGVLKRFVSREAITFNRKNRDPFVSNNFGFLTIVGNAPPRFLDKTDGVYRRLITFEFHNQVPEKERNVDYRSERFWKNSGELPGIFNLAVAGLRRVIKAGDLNIPQSILDNRAEQRTDQNVVAQFAEEFLEPSEFTHIPAYDLYKLFQAYNSEGRGSAWKPRSFYKQLDKELIRLKMSLMPKTKAKVNRTSVLVICGLKLSPIANDFIATHQGFHPVVVRAESCSHNLVSQKTSAFE